MGWDVVIEPVDIGDPGHLDRTLAHLAVRTASGRAAMGERHQPYTVAELRVDARPTTQHRCEHLVAVEHDAGQVVGAAELYFPLLDNTDHAFGQVDVLPQARRRGVGSTLVEHLIERTRAEGRRAVTIESVAATEQISEQRQDAGTAFAVRHGFSLALANHRSDLDLPHGAADLDEVLATVEAEVAMARPDRGYDVITCHGAVPPQWLDQRAVLAGRMTTDAPLGDLGIEPEAWDAARIRERDQMAADQGRHLIETVAVERATGDLAAATTLAFHPDHGEIAAQWDTLVLREHRGHRLGMWVKAANLRALLAAFPQVRRVKTYNAVENSPMLRVNRAMGFRPVGVLTEWQKRW